MYKYDGNNYTLYSNISDTHKFDWNYVQITEDHQFLTLAGYSGNFIKIYRNNGSGFEPLTNNATINYPHYVRYSSFSKDLEYFAVSLGNASTLIYRNTTQDNMTLQSTVSGRQYHRFSDDSQYLITGLNG